MNIEEKDKNGNVSKSSNNRNGNGNDNEGVDEFLTFTCQWDPVPVSIAIENNISTMRDVLLQKVGDEPSINDEYDLKINSSDKLYFQVKIANGNLVFRKSQFLNYTIRKIFAIKNLANPISIHIIRTFE